MTAYAPTTTFNVIQLPKSSYKVVRESDPKVPLKYNIMSKLEIISAAIIFAFYLLYKGYQFLTMFDGLKLFLTVPWFVDCYCIQLEYHGQEFLTYVFGYLIFGLK